MIKQQEIESILNLESKIKELTSQMNAQKKALYKRYKRGEKVTKGECHIYLLDYNALFKGCSR